MISIKELKNEDEWRDVFPVVHQLRTQLDETTYLKLVHEACHHEDYHLFALYAQQEPVSIVGFMPMTTLYYGRSIWVCDLVTDEAERSRGYGGKLLDFVQSWSREHGYAVIALSSGLQRKEAHRFYQEKAGYDKVSYVFKKKLD
ncbi:GNAT family N-acetyltransferase [Sporolactobacillus pectinivorans]|uniref:GNAT family N-acetyltransferase n=1 Tax=Sporolactobacillus pectinivorans TaxID=1591408 RepID=UPI000C264F88|nr:GNAT family N-acetyltransferase [Sporolactobacillus pectinivorans]